MIERTQTAVGARHRSSRPVRRTRSIRPLVRQRNPSGFGTPTLSVRPASCRRTLAVTPAPGTRHARPEFGASGSRSCRRRTPITEVAIGPACRHHVAALGADAAVSPAIRDDATGVPLHAGLRPSWAPGYTTTGHERPWLLRATTRDRYWPVRCGADAADEGICPGIPQNVGVCVSALVRCQRHRLRRTIPHRPRWCLRIEPRLLRRTTGSARPAWREPRDGTAPTGGWAIRRELRSSRAHPADIELLGTRRRSPAGHRRTARRRRRSTPAASSASTPSSDAPDRRTGCEDRKAVGACVAPCPVRTEGSTRGFAAQLTRRDTGFPGSQQAIDLSSTASELRESGCNNDAGDPVQ